MRSRHLSTAALTAVTVAAAAFAAPAVAAGGSVSPTPASYTPSLATSGTDGSVEQVRQLVRCGSTMYAVGRFSSIKQGASTQARNNAFSFSATTGALTSWNPNVNGTVNTVALSPDCSTAYLGGSFTTVGVAAAKNIAAVSTAGTGALISSFASSAGSKVNHMELVGGHLLVGGNFTSINGSTKKYMVSLSPATGSDDGYVNLNISGKYSYVQQDGLPSGSNSTNIYNMTLSPDLSKVLIMGVFTSVGGQPRRQLAQLNLGSAGATIGSFYSNEFNQNCYVREPFWLQDASWSPDGQKVYIATTGYKPASDTDVNDGVTSGFYTSEPRGGLCDSAAAFPITDNSSVSAVNGADRLWINYTGCDSLYSTAADSSTVYVGGHERWLNNPVQCDNNNSGKAVVDPGMGGLDPSNGMAITTTNPLKGKYVRGRGLGADDMLIVPAGSPGAGLWIASDNAQNTDSCGTTTSGAPAGGHSGICLLPY